jgi:hypothetical protein
MLSLEGNRLEDEALSRLAQVLTYAHVC